MPNGSHAKLFQYADDTSIFVMSDRSLLALFSLFERYERASGAKLNVNKSRGLLLGSWKDRQDMPVALNWSSELITVLGIGIISLQNLKVSFPYGNLDSCHSVIEHLLLIC